MPQIDPDQMRANRLYSQVDLPGLMPRDQPLRALKASFDAGGHAVLLLARSDRDFRAIEGMQLANLAPFLPQALVIWRGLQDERMRARLERQISSDLGVGWMLFGPAGNVTSLSGKARDLLQAVPGLRNRPMGWLELPGEDMAQALHRALTEAQATGQSSSPVDLSPDLQLTLLQAEPGLVGILRAAPRGRSLPLERVTAAHGLSRSEARLALLLCDGASLAEAAEELGWTVETARSCSKQVFARMGVKGQAAVIRRLLNGTLWLGQDWPRPS
ncbi:helix-turn-helix transcriptional regulator [Paracoccus sulfuroxidans]|uniref:DNA-binding CsgD family transcriptional regulator n=1 Tax=Paracoccus sulfuroxidans TaxID=384678 RepID=A0A562NUN0_9RHOB|nr:hypothetical protein [Paracoccus sulfuroxidans]TWI35937.1 DNA-binding CsgD family transcriptional regulator [Paracoccus sulfuroxidans]